MASDDLRDDRIVRRRGRKRNEAVNRLCDAWLRAGGRAFSGSLRIAADAADDVTSDGCGGGSSRSRDQDDDR
jgi:hypothetical protein